MSHTPGPWRTHAWGDTPSSPSVNYEILSCDDTALARIDLEFRDETGDPLVEDDEMAANARLIAAAPEMLVALRAAREDLSDLLEVAHLTDEGVADTTAVLNQVIAAIAKAEGRE